MDGNRFRKKGCAFRKNVSNLCPHLLAELGWRYARLLFEDMREICFFIKSQDETNLCNGFVCGDEQVFGFEQLTCFNDFGNTLVHHTLTDEVQVARGHKQFVGIKFHAPRFAVMLFQHLQETSESLVLHGHVIHRGWRVFSLVRFDDANQSDKQLFLRTFRPRAALPAGTEGARKHHRPAAVCQPVAHGRAVRCAFHMPSIQQKMGG